MRRGLLPALEGARIVRADVRRPDLRFPFPDGLQDLLTGARITALTRRAKYLLIELDRGTTLIAHLGMSGSYRVQPVAVGPSSEALGFQPNRGRTGATAEKETLHEAVVPSEEAPGVKPNRTGNGAREAKEKSVLGDHYHPRSTLGAHDHLVLDVEGGAEGPAQVIYNDPRRFGFVLAAETTRLHDHPMLRDLGPEPMGNALTPEHLAERFADRRSPLKAALLDQKNVAGLGNIYVCEVLSRSKLSPKRLAKTLVKKDGAPTERLARMVGHIRDVIGEAIEAGGSSLRDHKHTDGSLGYFQHRFGAYDREHEPCPNAGCRGTIVRIVQSGRSTFYCPTCQR